MKPSENTEVPPSDEQAEPYAWVIRQANGESDGMPETQLITNEGESL